MSTRKDPSGIEAKKTKLASRRLQRQLPKSRWGKLVSPDSVSSRTFLRKRFSSVSRWTTVRYQTGLTRHILASKDSNGSEILKDFCRIINEYICYMTQHPNLIDHRNGF